MVCLRITLTPLWKWAPTWLPTLCRTSSLWARRPSMVSRWDAHQMLLIKRLFLVSSLTKILCIGTVYIYTVWSISDVSSNDCCTNWENFLVLCSLLWFPSDFNLCCPWEDRPDSLCTGCCCQAAGLLWWLFWHSLPTSQTGSVGITWRFHVKRQTLV